MKNNQFDFFCALVATKKDPDSIYAYYDRYTVNNEQEMIKCEDFVNSDGVEVEEITPDNKDFNYIICSCLVFDLRYTNVERVYKARKGNEDPIYFCLDTDWSIKYEI